MQTIDTMPYDTIIFDLDGTISDNVRGIVACAQMALTEMGRTDVKEEQLNRFIGPPLYQSFVGELGMTPEDAARAITIYRANYEKTGMFANDLYEGIAQLVEDLYAQGVYLCLATGKLESFAQKILDHFGLSRYFAKVVGTTLQDLDMDKCAMIKSVTPASCKRAVMVGDRKYDIQGAHDAGIDSIYVLYGFGDEAEMAACKPTHVARDVETLRRILWEGHA